MQKLKTNMQKIKVCLSTKQGSVLVYSLIILSAMLFIVTSISVVSITEKKNASSTDASMQSYQTADSGVQLALKKINLGVASNQTLAGVFGAGNCVAGKVETNIDGGPATSNYSLSFEAEGVPISDCATLVNKVTSIKSVGTYKDTVRAVQVAVAAGDKYNISCAVNGTALQCCRMNIGTGETDCKSTTSSSGPWTAFSDKPWPTPVSGQYSISCAVNGTTLQCCRTNIGTSNTECKMISSLSGPWTAFSASPW